MRPLTVYVQRIKPCLVEMHRISMAWHSLGINRTSWHGQLTVSNSACDLCTAASNILLEQGHKSTAGRLTLYAIIHTPCFNCPIWRWCKFDNNAPVLPLTAHPFLLLAHTHTNLSLEKNQYGCMRCWVTGSAVKARAAEQENFSI